MEKGKPKIILRTMIRCFIFLSLANPVSSTSAQKASTIGPEKGWLMLEGGGRLQNAETVRRFVQLAGGSDGRLIVIPTAALALSHQPFNSAYIDHEKQWFADVFGIKDVALIHTFDRREAESESFVAPLRQATAVWIVGGSDSHLAATYVGTRTEREIKLLVARGGIVGGGSAGAMIQASYIVARTGEAMPDKPEGTHDVLVRGPREAIGFSLVTNLAVDAHLSVRHRENDMKPLAAAHPELLCVGIDETTAILVHGDEFEVIGEGKVIVWDGQNHGGQGYLVLSAGQKFDLKKRTVK